MTIRKLFFLFWTTCAIGTVTAPVAGFILQEVFGDIGLNLVRQLWAGVMFGAVAQMGFFAYMVFNMVFTGFIRSRNLYQGLQLLVTGIILANLFTLQPILALTVLLFSLAVAWFKMKATNPHGFIPALFFMTAATTLEAIPSLSQPLVLILLMVITLLVCNTWQIMQLHRLVDTAPMKHKETSR
ncbi:KinB-signaling pathway activation protein [Salinithrix halophila]|uniref:KinB-signaling pathway activation protein n=1 Tax=Salinithrix halophila TaxID=1485204 RepID=A0ABV8J919_9BACL